VDELDHDDVLDESDIRRRAATINRLWGNGRAVLLGDFLYSHAFHLCSTLPTPLAARLIGQTAVTVCEGEMMQVAHRDNWELSETEYLEIISRKTAALVETCCHLGAHYAGADEATIQRLRSFGHSLGVAFQIVDDLLDLTGDESEVGKSLGRDAAEGEPTLPLIHFLRTAPALKRARLLTAVRTNGSALSSGRTDGSERARTIVELLRDSDSIDYAQSAAQERIDQARRLLAGLPPVPPGASLAAPGASLAARDSLSAMTDFVLARRT
jgi:octaprenyl-diphosphate synthase